ncbi:MAG: hypothetical protein D6694_08765 [Gammaproteobacteria bacterium]|nr:MAG: hypothetical protein D6694_08765 [Gammaproteobacteria bacterium]
MDVETLKAELAGVMRVFEKPFAAKGMLFNYNIPFLDSIFDKVIFVRIKRDPLMNIQSVLYARERQLGNRDAWYSFDIPEKEELMKLSPIEQAAGQVACINRAIDQGLEYVADERKLAVQYEDFCSSPESFFRAMLSLLSHQGCEVAKDYQAERCFSSSNQLVLSKADADNALAVYRAYYNA